MPIEQRRWSFQKRNGWASILEREKWRRSEHAHASYPGLFFSPTRVQSLYGAGRKESSGTGLWTAGMNFCRIWCLSIQQLKTLSKQRFCTAAMLDGRNNRFFFPWEQMFFLMQIIFIVLPSNMHGCRAKPLQCLFIVI